MKVNLNTMNCFKNCAYEKNLVQKHNQIMQYDSVSFCKKENINDKVNGKKKSHVGRNLLIALGGVMALMLYSIKKAAKVHSSFGGIDFGG